MRRFLNNRWFLAVATVLVAGAASTIILCRRSPSSAASTGEVIESPEPTADWCAPGFEPVADGCLERPSGADPVPLVIYLHGLYERSAPEEEVERQKRLGQRAALHSYAVLALRSGLGICHPSLADYATRYCWPSNEEVAGKAGELVSTWKGALDAAEVRVGTGRRFVLGFSSGGYFAGLLAVRALLRADAFVIAHAGPVEPVRALGDKPPLLLLSADDDVAQESMIRLDGELSRADWPHDHYARYGGHALTDEDIETALSFFARAEHERLPLEPPISTHRAHLHERDAEPGAARLSESEEGGAAEASSPAPALDE